MAYEHREDVRMMRRLNLNIVRCFGVFVALIAFIVCTFAFTPVSAFAYTEGQQEAESPWCEEIVSGGTIVEGDVSDSSENMQQVVELLTDTETTVSEGQAMSAVLAAEEEQQFAFAIWDESSSTLSFHKQAMVPEAGSSFIGNDGVTRTATEVYRDVETAEYLTSSGVSKNTPWHEIAPQASSIIVVDRISPASIAYWFADFNQVVTLDLRNLDTAKSYSFSNSLNGCSSLTSVNIDKWDTSSLTDTRNMFKGCSSLIYLDLRGFNTDKVTNMGGMFDKCSSLVEIDLSSFSTGHMSQAAFTWMFRDCASLVTIYVGEGWQLSQIANIQYNKTLIFEGCTSIVGAMGTTYDNSNKYLNYARIDGGIDAPGYFSTHKRSFGYVTVSGIDMKYVLGSDKIGPTPVVTDGDKVLQEGVDYTVTFTPRAEKRNATLVVAGMGEYEGYVQRQYATMYILSRNDPIPFVKWSKEWVAEAEGQTAEKAAILLHSNSPLSELLRVMINGTSVDPKHYKAYEGSTVIEFEPEFLDSLKAGTYVVDIVSQNETVSAQLEIMASETTSEPTYCEVTFDANGGKLDAGTAEGKSICMADGRLLGLPAPSRENYSFDGWFTAASGGERVTIDTPFMSDATVYAQWTKSSAGDDQNASGDGDDPSVPATTAYKVIEGANGSYTINSGSTLTVRADGDIGKFAALLVDDRELERDTHYTVVSGSTVAILKPVFLDTLSTGSHKLTFRYSDGSVNTYFTVVKAPTVQDGSALGEDGSNVTQVDVAIGGASAAAVGEGSSSTGNPKTGDKTGALAWLILALTLLVVARCAYMREIIE